MFDMSTMKKIHDNFVDKEVWVITAKRKISRSGQVYAKRNELEVYYGIVNDIRIGEEYANGKQYPVAAANVSLRCPLEFNGETKVWYINGGYVPLNVRCFATEEEARNELALMSARTPNEQKEVEVKQLETGV